MAIEPPVVGEVIPSVFSVDADAVADWRVELPDDDGAVRAVELAVGENEILVHLIEECSRHNDHPDSLREVVDGANGE